MKQRLQKFFEGRQGMDELSKALFWGGLAALLLSGLCINLLNGALSTVLSWLGLAAVIFCFVRAFSRRLAQRETENNAFLAMRAKRKRKWEGSLPPAQELQVFQVPRLRHVTARAPWQGKDTYQLQMRVYSIQENVNL